MLQLFLNTVSNCVSTASVQFLTSLVSATSEEEDVPACGL